MPAKIDLTGKTFHRLKVIKESGRDAYGQVLWECECSCGSGKKVIVTGNDLRRNNTKSCGCLNKEKYTERIKKQTVNHSNISSIKSKKISKKNTSGVRGVCPTKRGRWRAYIGHKGKNVFLGEFSKKEDAIAARRKAEEQFFIPIFCSIDRKQEACYIKYKVQSGINSICRFVFVSHLVYDVWIQVLHRVYFVLKRTPYGVREF